MLAAAMLAVALLAALVSLAPASQPAEPQPVSPEAEPAEPVSPAPEPAEPAPAEPAQPVSPEPEPAQPVSPEPEPAQPVSPEPAEPAPAQSAPAEQAPPQPQPVSPEATPAEPAPAPPGAPEPPTPAGPDDDRRTMIGGMAVLTQAPPLRTEAVYLDPRFVGRSVALGGGGIFARHRFARRLGFDVGFRTGSIRYRDADHDLTVAEDQFWVDGGVLVFLGRGDIAQFAVSGGLGGMLNRVDYEQGDGPDGTQLFGTGLVYVGAEGEFLVKRIAFILSFRSYGAFTNRDLVRNRGALFDRVSPGDRAAPVAALRTLLVGSFGVAYRF